MSLIAVSDRGYQISGAERTLLKEFRNLGPKGKLLGVREFAGRWVRGHPLCTNRRPGGVIGEEDVGEPPHVLYVLWEWNR